MAILKGVVLLAKYGHNRQNVRTGKITTIIFLWLHGLISFNLASKGRCLGFRWSKTNWQLRRFNFSWIEEWLTVTWDVAKDRIGSDSCLPIHESYKLVKFHGLSCLSIISSALRHHLSLMLQANLKINYWMFPGWLNFKAYWLPARAFLQLDRKIANLSRAVQSSGFIGAKPKP